MIDVDADAKRVIALARRKQGVTPAELVRVLRCQCTTDRRYLNAIKAAKENGLKRVGKTRGTIWRTKKK